MTRECKFIEKRMYIEQVWLDTNDDKKRILKTKSMILFDEKISFRESWRQNDRWTSSMKLRWKSQIHLISLKTSHKQDIRYSKQIYLGLKIQIQEILTLFKEIIFFETKEIFHDLSIVVNIWWKDENSFEFHQEIDKLHQF